jgi:hypothetical protein
MPTRIDDRIIRHCLPHRGRRRAGRRTPLHPGSRERAAAAAAAAATAGSGVCGRCCRVADAGSSRDGLVGRTHLSKHVIEVIVGLSWRRLRALPLALRVVLLRHSTEGW